MRLETAAATCALVHATLARTVVDLGSGFSSAALRLARKAGLVRPDVEIHSVDDDPEWLRRTREFLERTDLPTDNLHLWHGFAARHRDSRFDVVLHETSTDEFCASCHEIEINISVEYETMSHARNATGVRVTCADCHVPKAFVPKMRRKIVAMREVYHHVLGTIDTPEKFEAHRMTMASRVWAEFNQTDSRECRDCHSENWDLSLQSEKARDFHSGALSRGKTCIDCHKGVAHKLPDGIMPDEQIPGMHPPEAT